MAGVSTARLHRPVAINAKANMARDFSSAVNASSSTRAEIVGGTCRSATTTYLLLGLRVCPPGLLARVLSQAMADGTGAFNGLSGPAWRRGLDAKFIMTPPK